MNTTLGFSIIEEFNKNGSEKNRAIEARKRAQRKRTQKVRNSAKRNEKVSNFMASIQSNTPAETPETSGGDGEDGLGDFRPLEHVRPMGAPAYTNGFSLTGQPSAAASASHAGVSPTQPAHTSSHAPSHVQANTSAYGDDQEVSREQFNAMSSQPSLYEGYGGYVANFENAGSAQQAPRSNEMLIEKLNYMIHLLEEQQEEKTGHVTEELILYSFLGVFIIFVIDSFARAGKYVR